MLHFMKPLAREAIGTWSPWGRSTYIIFLSLQFLTEVKLLSLQCQQPLPQLIGLLPIDQKNRSTSATEKLKSRAKNFKYKEMESGCEFIHKQIACIRPWMCCEQLWTRTTCKKNKKNMTSLLHFVLAEMFNVERLPPVCQDLLFLLSLCLLLRSLLPVLLDGRINTRGCVGRMKERKYQRGRESSNSDPISY